MAFYSRLFRQLLSLQSIHKQQRAGVPAHSCAAEQSQAGCRGANLGGRRGCSESCPASHLLLHSFSVWERHSAWVRRRVVGVSEPGISFFLSCYHPLFGQLLVWSSRGGFSASVPEFPLAAQTRWWGADFLCDVPAAAEMSAWCLGYRNECLFPIKTIWSALITRGEIPR